MISTTSAVCLYIGAVYTLDPGKVDVRKDDLDIDETLLLRVGGDKSSPGPSSHRCGTTNTFRAVLSLEPSGCVSTTCEIPDEMQPSNWFKRL